MHSALIRYHSFPVALRLLMISATAILLNGIYCLIYRYSSGDPATLWEAFSWGAINLAPWIAAIEIGRHLTRASHAALAIAAAAFASLLLGTAAQWELPDLFELVRRIPGIVFAILALATIELARRHRVRIEQPAATATVTNACDWVRAAGNYVELHGPGLKLRLVRASLHEFAEGHQPPLVRIHRSYAVSPASIARIERNHVRLECGLRLPIGDRYRDQLVH